MGGSVGGTTTPTVRGTAGYVRRGSSLVPRYVIPIPALRYVSARSSCRMATRVREKLEIAFLVCINCVILCLFSLPVIVYYTSQVSCIFTSIVILHGYIIYSWWSCMWFVFHHRYGILWPVCNVHVIVHTSYNVVKVRMIHNGATNKFDLFL